MNSVLRTNAVLLIDSLIGRPLWMNLEVSTTHLNHSRSVPIFCMDVWASYITRATSLAVSFSISNPSRDAGERISVASDFCAPDAAESFA